jgi:mRNA-degrading endonuclease RelE of RelBE toxin-antitoxin system
MYHIVVRKHLDRKFTKMAKKNPALLSALHKKLVEIIDNPRHFKNLEAPRKHLRRAHIGGSFVLLFSVDEKKSKSSLKTLSTMMWSMCERVLWEFIAKWKSLK